MKTDTKDSKSSVIPGLRYRDANRMIDWLCEVFGFEKQAVFAGPGGEVMHAQLTLGGGMIMVGSVRNEPAAAVILKQPDEVGGAETQAPYLQIADIESAYGRAKGAGARILVDLERKEYGGSAFACADPEGHVWHVGTFDPWDTKQA